MILLQRDHQLSKPLTVMSFLLLMSKKMISPSKKTQSNSSPKTTLSHQVNVEDESDDSYIEVKEEPSPQRFQFQLKDEFSLKPKQQFLVPPPKIERPPLRMVVPWKQHQNNHQREDASEDLEMESNPVDEEHDDNGEQLKSTMNILRRSVKRISNSCLVKRFVTYLHMKRRMRSMIICSIVEARLRGRERSRDMRSIKPM